MSAHDYIGVYEFKLHEVVTARDQIITRDLVNPAMGEGKAGRIVIAAEEVEATANSEIVKFNPVA